MQGDLLVGALELIVACSSVLSEHLLAREKSNGWVWSVIGSALAGFFFLLEGHTILALVEVLNIPFALYGFHKWKRFAEKATKTDTIMVFGAITVVLVYFFCGGGETNGVEQTIASAAFLIGGLLIARDKKIGWCLCLVADILLAYVLLKSSDYIFVCFQGLSIYIGIRKAFKKSISETNTALKGRVSFFIGRGRAKNPRGKLTIFALRPKKDIGNQNLPGKRTCTNVTQPCLYESA